MSKNYVNPNDPAIQNAINQAVAAHPNLTPALITGVAGAESSWNANAGSSAGAQGLMQLMPATARRYGVTNPNDPVQSIQGGSAYLSYLVDHYHGDTKLALMAYNAGEGRIDNYLNGTGKPLKPETINYPGRVAQNANGDITVAGNGSGSSSGGSSIPMVSSNYNDQLQATATFQPGAGGSGSVTSYNPSTVYDPFTGQGVGTYTGPTAFSTGGGAGTSGTAAPATTGTPAATSPVLTASSGSTTPIGYLAAAAAQPAQNGAVAAGDAGTANAWRAMHALLDFQIAGRGGDGAALSSPADTVAAPQLAQSGTSGAGTALSALARHLHA